MNKEGIDDKTINTLKVDKELPVTLEIIEDGEKVAKRVFSNMEKDMKLFTDGNSREIDEIDKSINLKDGNIKNEIKKHHIDNELKNINEDILIVKNTFVKKINKVLSYLNMMAKIGIVSTTGLLANELKAQDVIRVNGKENGIENTIELTNQIYKEIENGYKNGVLRNEPDNVYFYRLEKDGYDITYDLDFNYDNKKDDSPTFEIDYYDGNTTYVLKNGKAGADIAYNYKDNSLSNSKTKTYDEFFSEYMFIIPELYGKNQTLINFRPINNKEKQKFLNDMKRFFREVDSLGIKENKKNLKWVENDHQGIGKSKMIENEASSLATDLLKKLKSKSYPGESIDPTTDYKIIPRGMFTYEYGEDQFNIHFTDSNYIESNIYFEVNNGIIKLENMIKIINVDGKQKNQYISSEEALNIVKEALSELK